MKKKSWGKSHIDRVNPRNQTGGSPKRYFTGIDMGADLYNTLVTAHARRQIQGVEVGRIFHEELYKDAFTELVAMAEEMPKLKHHMLLLKAQGIDTVRELKSFCTKPQTNQWVNIWLDVRNHPCYAGYLNQKVLTLIKAKEYQNA